MDTSLGLDDSKTHGVFLWFPILPISMFVAAVHAGQIGK